MLNGQIGHSPEQERNFKSIRLLLPRSLIAETFVLNVQPSIFYHEESLLLLFQQKRQFRLVGSR